MVGELELCQFRDNASFRAQPPDNPTVDTKHPLCFAAQADEMKQRWTDFLTAGSPVNNNVTAESKAGR